MRHRRREPKAQPLLNATRRQHPEPKAQPPGLQLPTAMHLPHRALRALQPEPLPRIGMRPQRRVPKAQPPDM
jgi:hypothetical protein